MTDKINDILEISSDLLELPRQIWMNRRWNTICSQPGKGVILIVNLKAIYRDRIDMITKFQSYNSWWSRYLQGITLWFYLKKKNISILARSGQLHYPVLEHYKPDIVILDMEMPDLDSLKTLELIRKESPESRVIMFCSKENSWEHKANHKSPRAREQKTLLQSRIEFQYFSRAIYSRKANYEKN